MSGLVPVIIAAAVAREPAPAPPRNDLSIAIPSLDGSRGAAATYERWLPDRRLGVGVTVEGRESATGDYTGIRAGAGASVRWYWRARSWFGHHPPGSMIGWFIGGRFDAVICATHDVVDKRWLGTTLEVGVTGEVGYRIAPWRGLEVTPSVGVNGRRDLDLSGRLPAWSKAGISLGLAAGWLF